MTDLARQKALDLCDGYPAEFNAQAAYDLVVAAWKMGFDLVKAPAGANFYEKHLRESNRALQNAAGTQAGQQNAHPLSAAPGLARSTAPRERMRYCHARAVSSSRSLLGQ